MTVVFLILIGLSIFGCLQTGKPQTAVISPPINDTVVDVAPPEQIPDTYEVCAQEQNVLSSDECFLNYVKASKEISYCERIYAITSRDACYMEFAHLDVKLCAKIASSSLRSQCYYSSARLLNNTDYCVKISDAAIKQSCLVELSPPCSFEPDDLSKALCLSLHFNASSFCKVDDCMYSLGVTNKNIAACDQISDANRAIRSACRSVVLDDSALCKETGIDVVADYCYQIAAYSANKSAWCTLTTTGSPYGLQCLMTFASKNNEPTLCKYADSELERDNCYMNYSITTGNYSTCDLVINSLLNSQCFISTALTHGDMSSCNKLMYSSRKNCYNLVLTRTVPILSQDSCLAISESDVDPWQYRCLASYAQQTQNRSICQTISDSKYREDCNFRFS